MPNYLASAPFLRATKRRYTPLSKKEKMLLLVFLLMSLYNCINCISLHNDKAAVRGVRGKEQWQAKKRRYKFNIVLKHQEKYYVARDEGVEAKDRSEDEKQE
jgi:hypothetical protein